ncbi:helix-turn-helix domain-containing protein [Mycolicibacterium sp. F2034L]|uniref:helix-turn-helix domain-containing protein n=1 Tax=Mycolicibacterium sp. F2034L TaxID=2926422 RepID=UPI001FF37D59|nr:helix-turn-helix domain-containing protein [Mycolicibacterium sp. F2034L]MCK0174769.1 helix-turn-helix domain-containing protein [Mycolicibacterium sp. F2034L]
MTARTHSLAEAAELIGCTERWLADQLRARRFPARKINARWRMTDEDIAAAIEACKQPARTEISAAGMTRTTRRRMTA